MSDRHVGATGSEAALRCSESRKSLSALFCARVRTASRLSQYAMPDTDTAAKLVAALKALNPDIVSAGPEKTVEAARKECQAVYNYPKDHAKLVELTGSTFTSAAHPQGFGPEVSEKILAAVQASGLCTRP